MESSILGVVFCKGTTILNTRTNYERIFHPEDNLLIVQREMSLHFFFSFHTKHLHFAGLLSLFNSVLILFNLSESKK
jgi:hypothetical protein